MKNSGIEWIGEIPSDWEVHRVKSHYSIVSGSGFKPDLQGKLSGDYPVCKASDISSAGKNLFFAANYITVDVANKEGFSVIPYGSIIFAKIGEAMRKNNRSICRVNCCADNNCQGLVPNNIDVDYGYYLFNCIDMKWFDNAGTVPCINNQKLKDCGIPFPNIIEQKKISHFLDEKCAEIDMVIEKTKATIEEYKKLKQSVITQAVTKGLRPNRPMKDSGIEWIGEIPADWDVKRGKAILTLLEKPVKESDSVITCFRDGQVTLRSNRREDGFTFSLQEVGYQGIDVGDLVVHGMDGFAGAIGISDSRGKGTPVLNVMDSTENKRYIMYYLRNMAYNGVFIALATGIRVRSCDTNWNKLKNLPYIIPSHSEQQEIVDYIDRRCSEIDELIAKKTSLLSELESYKKSLIYEYITGKKEV